MRGFNCQRLLHGIVCLLYLSACTTMNIEITIPSHPHEIFPEGVLEKIVSSDSSPIHASVNIRMLQPQWIREQDGVFFIQVNAPAEIIGDFQIEYQSKPDCRQFKRNV